jgi:hypothetical protein
MQRRRDRGLSLSPTRSTFHPSIQGVSAADGPSVARRRSHGDRATSSAVNFSSCLPATPAIIGSEPRFGGLFFVATMKHDPRQSELFDGTRLLLFFPQAMPSDLRGQPRKGCDLQQRAHVNDTKDRLTGAG